MDKHSDFIQLRQNPNLSNPCGESSENVGLNMQHENGGGNRREKVISRPVSTHEKSYNIGEETNSERVLLQDSVYEGGKEIKSGGKIKDKYISTELELVEQPPAPTPQTNTHQETEEKKRNAGVISSDSCSKELFQLSNTINRTSGLNIENTTYVPRSKISPTTQIERNISNTTFGTAIPCITRNTAGYGNKTNQANSASLDLDVQPNLDNYPENETNLLKFYRSEPKLGLANLPRHERLEDFTTDDELSPEFLRDRGIKPKLFPAARNEEISDERTGANGTGINNSSIQNFSPPNISSGCSLDRRGLTLTGGENTPGSWTLEQNPLKENKNHDRINNRGDSGVLKATQSGPKRSSPPISNSSLGQSNQNFTSIPGEQTFISLPELPKDYSQVSTESYGTNSALNPVSSQCANETCSGNVSFQSNACSDITSGSAGDSERTSERCNFGLIPTTSRNITDSLPPNDPASNYPAPRKGEDYNTNTEANCKLPEIALQRSVRLDSIENPASAELESTQKQTVNNSNGIAALTARALSPKSETILPYQLDQAEILAHRKNLAPVTKTSPYANYISNPAESLPVIPLQEISPIYTQNPVATQGGNYVQNRPVKLSAKNLDLNLRSSDVKETSADLASSSHPRNPKRSPNRNLQLRHCGGPVSRKSLNKMAFLEKSRSVDAAATSSLYSQNGSSYDTCYSSFNGNDDADDEVMNSAQPDSGLGNLGEIPVSPAEEPSLFFIPNSASDHQNLDRKGAHNRSGFEPLKQKDADNRRFIDEPEDPMESLLTGSHGSVGHLPPKLSRTPSTYHTYHRQNSLKNIGASPRRFSYKPNANQVYFPNGSVNRGSPRQPRTTNERIPSRKSSTNSFSQPPQVSPAVIKYNKRPSIISQSGNIELKLDSNVSINKCSVSNNSQKNQQQLAPPGHLHSKESKQTQAHASYRLGFRRSLFEKRKKLSDYAMLFSLIGISLMVLEHELSYQIQVRN